MLAAVGVYALVLFDDRPYSFSRSGSRIGAIFFILSVAVGLYSAKPWIGKWVFRSVVMFLATVVVVHIASLVSGIDFFGIQHHKIFISYVAFGLLGAMLGAGIWFLPLLESPEPRKPDPSQDRERDS